jgi:hypothetical protein
MALVDAAQLAKTERELHSPSALPLLSPLTPLSTLALDAAPEI